MTDLRQQAARIVRQYFADGFIHDDAQIRAAFREASDLQLADQAFENYEMPDGLTVELLADSFDDYRKELLS